MIRRVLLIAVLLSVLFTLSVPFAQAQDGSITTTFAGGNSFAGNMFDVTALTTLTITAFDVHLDPVNSADIDIYYKAGTYVGFESDSGAWTLLGSDSVTAAGINNPTRVEVGGLTIPAGETYGLYVDVASYPSTSMQYTNGNNVYSNADITLTLGIGRGDPAFSGSIFNPRTWNGTIYYTLGTSGGEAPPPPSGCPLVLPAGSVVGDAPFETQVYYEPGNASPGVLLNPGTYIVTGQDASETYYQIMLACQFVWVRKDAMQPSYQPPQNGAALPTTIIGAISTGDTAGGSDADGG